MVPTIEFSRFSCQTLHHDIVIWLQWLIVTYNARVVLNIWKKGIAKYLHMQMGAELGGDGIPCRSRVIQPWIVASPPVWQLQAVAVRLVSLWRYNMVKRGVTSTRFFGSKKVFCDVMCAGIMTKDWDSLKKQSLGEPSWALWLLTEQLKKVLPEHLELCVVSSLNYGRQTHCWGLLRHLTEWTMRFFSHHLFLLLGD